MTGVYCKVRSPRDLQTSQTLEEAGRQRRAGTYSDLTVIPELTNASGTEIRAAAGACRATGALWAAEWARVHLSQHLVLGR